MLSSFPCAQAVRRTKDRIRRARGKSSSGRDPGATGFAADELFRLLLTGIRARGARLLELPQGSDEFLDQPEVRAQPPEQQKQQQGYEGDNYQVLQIAFSAVMITVTDACD